MARLEMKLVGGRWCLEKLDHETCKQKRFHLRTTILIKKPGEEDCSTKKRTACSAFVVWQFVLTRRLHLK